MEQNLACDQSILAEHGVSELSDASVIGWSRRIRSADYFCKTWTKLRTSFVVGRDCGAGAGALGTLGLIVKLGLGGKVASGTQGMSWIHEDDINAIFIRAIVDETMSGAYIVSSPNPQSQADFMRTLRKVIGMPVGLPAFEWMVRVGAPFFLRTDPELVLYGRYVIPKRLMDEGFEFRFAELEPALRELYDRNR